MSLAPATRCANCDAALAAGQAWCGACGQAAHAGQRLTLHEIGHELLHALMHVDRSVPANSFG